MAKKKKVNAEKQAELERKIAGKMRSYGKKTKKKTEGDGYFSEKSIAKRQLTKSKSTKKAAKKAGGAANVRKSKVGSTKGGKAVAKKYSKQAKSAMRKASNVRRGR